MVSTSFIFGGKDMPKTPQELARMRAMAEALAPRRTPQNVGEGIAAIGNALAMRMMMSRADKAENARLKSAEDAYSSLFSTPETVDQTTSTPDLTPPADVSAAPVIKSPQDAIDAAPAKPVSSDVASMEAYIRQAATARGMDPDTAVRVARSEGLAPGVWQSRVKKNGAFEPSYGPFQMLVGDGTNFPKGMGNDFMAKTGLDPTDPKNANAMIDFALDRAKEGGWSPWYGAKKAGIERWQGINANEVAGLPDAANALQSTETEGAVPVAPVPDGFQGEDPLAARKPSTKVAQALTRRRVDPEKAFQVLSDPFLPEGKRAVLQSLIKRQFDEDNARLKQELEQADPKYKLELEKGQLELQKLKNPEKARRLTEEEERKGGLDTSGVYDILPDGSTKVVQEPKKRNTATVDGRVVDTDTGKVIADFSTPTADWDKLDDGRLFNKRTGEIKDAGGNTVGFRFPGNSVEAAALNRLIEQKVITEQQALELATGKSATGPSGENLFIKPQALIGAEPESTRNDGSVDIFAGTDMQAQPSDSAVAAPVTDTDNGIVTLTGPKGRFDDASALRKEIQQLPSYKNLAQSMPIYRSMVETAGRNTKASDLNLVYGLGKIMDPTSVVREGEMIMVKNTASIPDWLQGAIAQINGGSALTPETRAAIMQEAYGRVQGYDTQFKTDADMYRGIVQRSKFDEADIIPSFGEYLPWKPDAGKEDMPPAPEGLDAETWKHMTPEERKLWQN